jgi:hypothetical protein
MTLCSLGSGYKCFGTKRQGLVVTIRAFYSVCPECKSWAEGLQWKRLDIIWKKGIVASNLTILLPNAVQSWAVSLCNPQIISKPTFRSTILPPSSRSLQSKRPELQGDLGKYDAMIQYLVCWLWLPWVFLLGRELYCVLMAIIVVRFGCFHARQPQPANQTKP